MSIYSIYPGAIDGYAQLPLVIDTVTRIDGVSVNRLRDAIINIETELGINPSSSFTDVATRLEYLTTNLEVLQSDYSELLDQFTELEAGCEGANCDEFEAQIVILEAQIAALEAEILDLNSQISDLNDEISDLNDYIAELEEDLATDWVDIGPYITAHGLTPDRNPSYVDSITIDESGMLIGIDNPTVGIGWRNGACYDLGDLTSILPDYTNFSDDHIILVRMTLVSASSSINKNLWHCVALTDGVADTSTGVGYGWNWTAASSQRSTVFAPTARTGSGVVAVQVKIGIIAKVNGSNAYTVSDTDSSLAAQTSAAFAANPRLVFAVGAENNANDGPHYEKVKYEIQVISW